MFIRMLSQFRKFIITLMNSCNIFENHSISFLRKLTFQMFSLTDPQKEDHSVFMLSDSSREWYSHRSFTTDKI